MRIIRNYSNSQNKIIKNFLTNLLLNKKMSQKSRTISSESTIISSDCSISSEDCILLEEEKQENKNKKFKLFTANACLSKKQILRHNFTPSQEAGEDAFFISSTNNYTTLGVADGVGGWNTMGINPAIFSNSLMCFCEEVSKKTGNALEVVTKGYDKLKGSEIEAGSSTVCVVCVDLVSGVMNGANLGDSGYLVFRFGLENNNSSDCSDSSDSLDSNGNPLITLQLIHESKDLQHYFNAPYQLSILPSNLTLAQRKFFMCDQPEDCLTSEFQLKEGDLILLATDGCFDNLFVEDMMQIIYEEFQPIYYELPDFSNGELLQSAITRVTQRIANEAAVYSLSDRPSPFGLEAARHKLFHDGGKIDDCCVVCGVVGVNSDSSINSDDSGVDSVDVLIEDDILMREDETADTKDGSSATASDIKLDYFTSVKLQEENIINFDSDSK